MSSEKILKCGNPEVFSLPKNYLTLILPNELLVLHGTDLLHNCIALRNLSRNILNLPRMPKKGTHIKIDA